MTDNQNVALLRKGHQAFSNQDRDTLTEVIADDVVWHVAGRSQLSGDYQGRAAVFAFFDKVGERSGGTMRIEDQDFLGSDERAVALFKVSATRAGKTLEADYCEVTRWRNGQVIEDWGFAFDQYAWDEFWS